HRAAQANAGARARAEAAAERARTHLADCVVRRESTQKQVDDATAAAAVLRAVEGVLGTRGVRALVLTRALAALELEANRWLRRFPTEHGVLRVHVAGTTTRANGAEADVIS